MTLSLDDLTPELRRTRFKRDHRFGPAPETLSPMHAKNVRVLARFAVADEGERRLTDRGRRLMDEEAAG